MTVPRWSLWQPGNRHIFAYLLLTPAVLLTAAIIVYPIFSAIDLSFQRIKIAKLGRSRAPFTLRNYEELFSSPEFFQAIWVTITLVATVTIVSYIIGLATAVLVNQRFAGAQGGARLGGGALGSALGDGSYHLVVAL